MWQRHEGSLHHLSTSVAATAGLLQDQGMQQAQALPSTLTEVLSAGKQEHGAPYKREEKMWSGQFGTV